jgi:hypothetical protein
MKDITKYLSIAGIVLTFLCTGFWKVFDIVKENAEAKAELKMQKKYETILTDYILLRAECNATETTGNSK